MLLKKRIEFTRQKKKILALALFFGFCWVSVILGIMAWDIAGQQKAVTKLAMVEARALFNKDLVYRRWASAHGGAYVPATEETPPNPYLAHLPERDITTPSGKNLTLVNPAYMTRQIHELGMQDRRVLGHITSLNPLRPENRADAWETLALNLFRQGKKETHTVEKIKGEAYLRLMRPLMVEEKCLNCHAGQGYRLGDQRGGISVAVSLSPYDAIARASIRKSRMIYLAILMVGGLGLVAGLLVVVRQVDEQVLIERSLRESKKDLSRAQSVAHIGSWAMDFSNEKLKWSRETYRIFNMPVGPALTTQMIMAHVHPGDLAAVGKAWRGFLSGEPYAVEHRIIAGDAVKWVDARAMLEVDDQGAPLRAVGTIRDISSRRSAEEKIRQSEERYRSVVDNANDAIIVHQDGGIVFANPSAALLTGYPIDELILKPVMEIIHPEDRERVQRDGRMRLEGGGASAPFRFRIRRSDGSTRTIQGSVIVIAWKMRDAMLAFLSDITEMLSLEKEAKKIETRLQQAQKMESIGTLAGGIAHDFNNILSAVIGYTELSLDETSANSSLEGNLREILVAGQRAKGLVKQILTFSRQAEQDLKPVHVGRLVKEALQLLRSTLPTTIDIVQNLESDALIMGDPVQIHQILMNLCTNAAQAMEKDGGRMRVCVTELKLQKSLTSRFPLLEPRSYLKLSVEDNGPGIASDLQKSIFDPYFSTKKPGEGTGLGLSVVHGIVKSYKGDIMVESEPGGGTQFTVLFPIHRQAAAGIEPAPAALPTGHERLLVVDDEPAIVQLTRKIANKLGYTAKTRTSSLEALALFKKNSAHFDLVITDMTMPHLTGEELAVEMMRIRPDIPVILCTGYSKKVSENLARDVGIKAVLMKPILMDRFAATVREVLDQAASSRQTP